MSINPREPLPRLHILAGERLSTAIDARPKDFFYSQKDGREYLDLTKIQSFFVPTLSSVMSNKDFETVSRKVGEVLVNYMSSHPETLTDEAFRAFYDKYKGDMIILPSQAMDPKLANFLSKYIPDHTYVIERSTISSSLEISPEVKHLKVSGVTDAQLRDLVRAFPRLKSINLAASPITDEGLMHLLELTSLMELNITACTSIKGSAFTALQRLPISTLHLGGCDGIIRENFSHLQRLPLTNLYLFRCKQITDAELAYFANLPLTNLVLEGCHQITDEGLIFLQRMPLTQLSLWGCTRITTAGFTMIGNIATLVELDLAECSLLEDEGLSHIGTLTALKHLDLGDCSEITDQGLFFLRGLTLLEDLNLRGCEEITDLGITALVERLPALIRLNLEGCVEITDDALDRIEDARPNLEIIVD